jgi:hypothetical protein
MSATVQKGDCEAQTINISSDFMKWVSYACLFIPEGIVATVTKIRVEYGVPCCCHKCLIENFYVGCAEFPRSVGGVAT